MHIKHLPVLYSVLALQICCVLGGTPKFGLFNHSYITEKEDFPVGGLLVTVTVIDSDANDNISVTAYDEITAEFAHFVEVSRTLTPSKVVYNVILGRKLERDGVTGKAKIGLKFKAVDNTLNTVTKGLDLYIEDVNDNYPIFKNEPYKWELKERPYDALINTSYTHITATDLDQSTFGTVTYSLTPTAQSAEINAEYKSTFNIDPITGSVKLLKRLDFETNSFYQYNITATDGGGLSTTTTFIVRVLDVQDTPPFFTGIPYRTSISESTALQTSVINVHAVDGDHGVPNKIMYTLVQGNSTCAAYFNVSPDNGTISTIADVDIDTGDILKVSGICTLQIQAREINKTSAKQYGATTTPTTVTIMIDDENDNIPTFNTSTTYTASVPENTAENVPITLTTPIYVVDRDQKAAFSTMQLTLLYQNGTDCTDFVSSPRTIRQNGTVMILVKNSKLLDFEVIQDITIMVVATEQADSSNVATATVVLAITDVNDNNPQFGNESYTFDINENSANHTIVNTITASDADSIKVMTYSISGGDDKFVVDANTGVIYVKCNTCSDDLNRETRDIYYMTYTATDEGNRSNSTSLVIRLNDVNDNNPQFDRHLYPVYIKENDNDSISEALVTVEATDKDLGQNKNISYSILSVQPALVVGNFTIGSHNGELLLQTPLDYELLSNVSGVINITVVAKDQGNNPLNGTTEITVTVQDMNDNAPVFTKSFFHAKVLENATSTTDKRSYIGLVKATDGDGTDRNRKLRYFITAGAFEKFSIEPLTGQVYVQTNAHLDRETVAFYNITINAIDEGSPPMTGTATISVTVEDVNDEPPTFDKLQYSASVQENMTHASSIITCTAQDLDINNHLVYSIINIDAKDEDGNVVNAALVKGYFNIGRTNGSIISSDGTDRETASTIQLSILVEDENAFPHNKRQNATATVIITLDDINDNSPEFDMVNYVYNISENAKDPSILTTIKATDKDVNRTMLYKLEPGYRPTSSFTISNDTGLLRKTGYIDRETNQTIILQITATDNGIPSRTSTLEVTINIDDFNDNAPVFVSNMPTHITVLENTTVNTTVLQVNATDLDFGPNSNVTYSIDGADEKFSIDLLTGVIRVTHGLDREMKDNYQLAVTAKDNPISKTEQKSSQTTIQITVSDINDNNPHFDLDEYKKFILENVKIGSKVMTVTAKDKDKEFTPASSINYKFVNNTEPVGLFTIDATTGVISVNASLKSYVKSHVIEIEANDNGNPKLANSTIVNITVLDVNLNRPNMTNLQPTIKVYECVSIGSVVNNFSYTDADHGINADAFFNISSVTANNDALKVFSITEDGLLTTVSNLDANKKATYEFQIQVTDKGTPALSSPKSPVVISVTDINDHLPEFKNNNTQLKVSENGTIGEYVGTVTAVDLDKDSKSCYDITGGDLMSNFTIDINNGSIYTTDILDRESTSQITLTILVRDCDIINSYHKQCPNATETRVETRKNITTVHIDVTDINDNPPIFTSKSDQQYIFIGMRTETAAGTALDLQLRNGTYVTDLDSPKNGRNVWTFSNGGNITQSKPGAPDTISPVDGVDSCADKNKHLFCITVNGTIINNKYFTSDTSGYFIVPVTVKDDVGSDTTKVKIYLIGNSQILVMTVGGTKEETARIKDEIMDAYSKITGYRFVYDYIQDHMEGDIPQPWLSDLYFHMVKEDTQEVLDASKAQGVVDKNNEKLIKLKNQFATYEISSLTSRKVSPEKSTAEKSFYIMVAIIVALALTMAIIVYVSITTKNKYKRKLRAATVKPFDKDVELQTSTFTVPGSNQYSKQANPLLNAKVEENPGIEMDEISLNSNNSLDANDVDDAGQQTLYDTMEEREETIDMFTEDVFVASNVESPLDAALKHYDHIETIRKSREDLTDIPDSVPTSGDVFINNAFDEDMECTDI